MDILRRGWYINHSGVSGTSRRMGSDVTKIVAKEGESNAVIFTTCNKNYEIMEDNKLCVLDLGS